MRREDIERWEHLSDLHLSGLSECKEVGMLIGQDFPEIMMPLKVRAATNHEEAAPFATRTLLGWTINGPVGSKEASRTASTAMMCAVNELDLGLQIDRFWKLDISSIQEASSNEKGHSVEDRRALKIMEESIKKEDGHYSIAVPFKQEVKSLPTNRVQAERRLACLAKKLQRNPALKEAYVDGMRSLIEKQYAEKVVNGTVEDWFNMYIG